MSFEKAAAFVLSERIEGGWSNHPNDRGGRTRYGLSERWNPDVDLDTLTPGGARLIYRVRYWDAVRGDELPTPLWLPMFDWAVHDSPRDAIRGLQWVVGAKQDGLFGDRTMERVRIVDPLGAAIELVDQRARKLVRTVIADPTQQEFSGWIERLIRLCVEMGKLVG